MNRESGPPASMPVIKSARPWKNAGTRIFLSLGGAWFVFMVVVVSLTDNPAVQKTVGLISFVAFAVSFVVLLRGRQPEFRCLDCGGEVQTAMDTTNKGGEPILRLCPRCNVLWHVGNYPEPD